MPDGAEQSSGRGSETLQIGVWTVEPGLNQLSASGRTLKLEPKAMALLRYLAERPGQVVSRDALLSAIWPGVVVGDDSLTQAVIKLRNALGDTADSPAYIQTIPKGRYRLVAPVGRPETIASAPVAPDPESAPRTERQRRVRWLAPAGVIALLLAAAGVWWIAGDGLSDLGGVSPDAPAF